MYLTKTNLDDQPAMMEMNSYSNHIEQKMRIRDGNVIIHPNFGMTNEHEYDIALTKTKFHSN